MLFIIQFPIVDYRQFLPTNNFLLPRPSWPMAEADEDFVRSFGAIRKRPRGGIDNWMGEHVVCEADNALRFTNLPAFTGTSGYAYFRTVFRRFYFDGFAVGKFEVGIEVQTRELLRSDASNLIYFLLALKVRVPNIVNPPMTTSLVNAGKSIAALYQKSSFIAKTPTFHASSQVEAGKPVLVIVRRTNEKYSFTFWGKAIPPELSDFNLVCFDVPSNGKTINLWEFTLTPHHWRHHTKNLARLQRIALLRLHAEQTCLLKVLRAIKAGKIVVKRDAQESENLQFYLTKALKRIRKQKEQVGMYWRADVAEAVKEFEDVISPGQRMQLLEALEQTDMRLNIKRDLKNYVQNTGGTQNVFNAPVYNNKMGDQINIGDISNSIVNIKATLDNVEQRIGSAATIDDDKKAELQKLIANLNEELEEAAASEPEGAERVAKAADVVVSEVTKSNPDKNFLGISLEGLKAAAEAVAAIAPPVTAVVAQILKLVPTLVQIA